MNPSSVQPKAKGMALPAVALLCRPVFLVAGFVWPSYASYKALEGRSTEPITVWLTYWVALSFVTVFSALLDPLVGSWMPLYYPLQLGLVLWLMLPQTKGASILYSQLLLPLLSKHEASIDHVLEVGKRKTEEWVRAAAALPPIFTHRCSSHDCLCCAARG